jgi:hypothetical protein
MEENNGGKAERLNENDFEDNRNRGQEGKRENARTRYFEMRVNNITIINDKINGLLSLIKKDKVDDVFIKPKQDKVISYEKHNKSAHHFTPQ